MALLGHQPIAECNVETIDDTLDVEIVVWPLELLLTFHYINA